MRKVGRLCPSEDELAPFFAALVPQGVSKRAGLTIHEGRLGAHPVAALYSGVCKVNAAIAAQTLIDACGVDALVVSGVAGGLDAAARPFDLVIARETAYHDVAEDILTEYHPWMESIWFQSDAALLARAEAAAGTTGARGDYQALFPAGGGHGDGGRRAYGAGVRRALYCAARHHRRRG